MNTTSHFQARCQQRAISPAMVEMILDLGRTNGKGDLYLTSSRDFKQEIRAKKEELRLLEKMLVHRGAGIAADGDAQITVFHRHKKFKR